MDLAGFEHLAGRLCIGDTGAPDHVFDDAPVTASQVVGFAAVPELAVFAVAQLGLEQQTLDGVGGSQEGEPVLRLGELILLEDAQNLCPPVDLEPLVGRVDVGEDVAVIPRFEA